MSKTGNTEPREGFIAESPAQTASDDVSNNEAPVAAEQKKEAGGFEYVVPDLNKKKRKKRRKHRRSTTPHATLKESADGYILETSPKKHKHRRHRHKKKLPLWLRILIIVLSVILILAATVTAAYFIMKEIGRSAMHNYDNIDITIPQTDDTDNGADVINKGHTIKYGGKTYVLNKEVMSVTFIGFQEDRNEEGSGKMADAIYIVAVDSYTGKTSIVGVSRDTMADVDLYSVEGSFIETALRQICYAYSYESSKVKGGENVNKSLTRLFFGMPMNNYFAIDMESLEAMNDAIGGVTLTSMMTFESKEYGRTINEGEEITLYGEDVGTYVRSRDLDDLESNNTRMDRQQQYIKAFLASIVPAAKKDISTATKLLDVINDNGDSSLDLPKITYLATTALSKMRNASDIEYIRLPGEIKAGEHAELYPDNKDILEIMLKVFYTPVE